eukprot:3090546-Rhodomonas_salina.1
MLYTALAVLCVLALDFAAPHAPHRPPSLLSHKLYSVQRCEGAREQGRVGARARGSKGAREGLTWAVMLAGAERGGAARQEHDRLGQTLSLFLSLSRSPLVVVVVFVALTRCAGTDTQCAPSPSPSLSLPHSFSPLSLRPSRSSLLCAVREAEAIQHLLPKRTVNAIKCDPPLSLPVQCPCP